jgi:hypothetical protein
VVPDALTAHDRPDRAASRRRQPARRVVTGAARITASCPAAHGGSADAAEAHDAAGYTAMVERVRGELLAAGVGPAHPGLDVAVERIVDVVGRFVLEWGGD